MRPAFLGFEIARSALFATQQQLDLTGHNIANASVDGYSRQRLDLSAAPDLYGLGQGYPGTVGEGVRVDQLNRLRDGLLDRDWRGQEEQFQSADTRQSYLKRLEYINGNLGDTSLQTAFEDFFGAWQDLSQRPEDPSLRRIIVEKGQSLTQLMQNIDAQAQSLQGNAQQELTQTVGRINELSSRLAQINPELVKRAGQGDTPADLLDERDRILDELGGYARIQVNEDPYGQVQVQIDGKAIVNGNSAHEIVLQNDSDILRGSAPIGIPTTLNSGDLVINGVDIVGSDPSISLNTANDYSLLVRQINQHTAETGVLASQDPAGQLVLSGTRAGSSYVNLQVSGNGANITGLSGGNYTLTSRRRLQIRSSTFINDPGGKLEGLQTVRNQDIPDSLQALNQISADLIQRLNLMHGNAYDLQGQNGNPFFTGSNPADMAVSSTLVANPNQVSIAASAVNPPGDGSVALNIYNLRSNLNLDERLQTLVTNLGTRIDHLQGDTSRLDLVRQQIDNERQSVAGVNMDEELSRMLQQQTAFNAAARMMNTFDSMLNQIVNGLGA